ncbi:conserved hypothetical protein [uncultured Thiomicrorhabdus sp.]
MKNSILNRQNCILKVCGKHGLVFKARHDDIEYLQHIAEELLAVQQSDFTSYEIHISTHANEEMTAPEHLLHIDAEQLRYNY